MGKLKYGIISLLLLVALLYPPTAYAVPADVTDISDSKYFDAVHSALKSAKSSIYVSLFDVSFSENSKESLQYILLQDLIDAHKRGIKVIVRLNREYDRNAVPQRNESACFLLVREGIDCKRVAPGVFLHDKLIVIDEEIVVDGSANWTTPALKTNRESTTLIRSKEYAQEKIARIRNLEISEEEIVDPLQIQTVPIPDKFLRDPKLGAHIVHTRSGLELDTYLFFLRQFHETGKVAFELDYEKLAAYLGLNYSNRDVTRAAINRALRYLKTRYKLIDCKLFVGKPAQVTLLDYDDKNREYKEPGDQYFGVPKAFWEYGWSRKLDSITKYFYLINLYNTECSESKPWWSFSLDRLVDDFHLGKSTVRRGLEGLKKAGLLDVEYDDVLFNDKGKFISREPNKYRLRPLLYQETIDKQWVDLKKGFSENEVKKARELAALIGQDYDIGEVRSFINIMTIYGRDRVEKATKITARMKANNPARNFGYIVGILKNWEKEGQVDY